MIKDKAPRTIVPKFVDISHHNTGSLPGGRIDFKALRAAGVLGVVHKATQGTKYPDKTYHERRVQALDAGLLWGLYHFPNNLTSGPDQVDYCLNYAKPDANTATFLDAEEDTTDHKTMTEANARTFMDAMMAATKRKPGLYSGNWARENITPSGYAYWGQFRLWLCQYNAARTYYWQEAWAQPWAIQYTDGDRQRSPGPWMLPGFDPHTKLDINSYWGTDDELRSSWAGEAV